MWYACDNDDDDAWPADKFAHSYTVSKPYGSVDYIVIKSQWPPASDTIKFFHL